MNVQSARDIAQMLASRAASYAQFLLPNGRMEGGNWCVGSVGGEAGGSLRVQVSGPNAGVWADFAAHSTGTSNAGDLLNLTQQVRQVTIGEAIKIAKEWLGIRDPESVVPKKTYTTPKPKGIKAITDDSAVFNYLVDERQIDFFTQEAFRIRQSVGQSGPEIAFPYLNPAGELVNVKRIALKRNENGKKIIRQEAGCAPSLFGWQAMNHNPTPGQRGVIITEGEIDAMTWHQMGFPALSVPDGAGGQTWIDYEWENLQRFDEIWLNWDNDTEGQKHVKEFARRLGLHRCLILTIPGYKDANEALMAGAGPDVFSSAIAAARPLSPEQIKAPVAFRDQIIEKFFPPNGRPIGFYPSLFESKLRLQPGDVTLWTGISGHGKTNLLNQIILEAVVNDYRAAIASMEMKGGQTLHRMLCQAEASSSLSVGNIDRILEWMSGKLWIYDLMGNVPTKTLMELMEYSFSRHGVNMFVIDSLMKCGVKSDDYDAQRYFLNQLCSFAKETGTHVHLVAHARKGRDESEAPGKMDVKGSSDIINQPDNVLAVWRNKEKEAKQRDERSDYPNEPDTVVYCTKQRESGDEFSERLSFLKPIFRFKRMGEDLADLSILRKLAPEQTEFPAEPEPPITDEDH